MTRTGSFSSRPWLVVVVTGAAMLSSCRHLSPVERHFLRMPADCAGGLSRIERAQWLKHSRRSLPSSKVLRESGYLALPGTETKRGTMLRGLELLHVPAADGNGGLAVVTTSGTSTDAPVMLHLLEHDRFTFNNVTERVLGRRRSAPGGWKISPEPLLMITGYGSDGGVIRKVWWGYWDNQRWFAR